MDVYVICIHAICLLFESLPSLHLCLILAAAVLQGEASSLGLCSRCYRVIVQPFSESESMLAALRKRYRYQLIVGCGASSCGQPHCATAQHQAAQIVQEEGQAHKGKHAGGSSEVDSLVDQLMSVSVTEDEDGTLPVPLYVCVFLDLLPELEPETEVTSVAQTASAHTKRRPAEKSSQLSASRKQKKRTKSKKGGSARGRIAQADFF